MTFLADLCWIQHSNGGNRVHQNELFHDFFRGTCQLRLLCVCTTRFVLRSFPFKTSAIAKSQLYAPPDFIHAFGQILRLAFRRPDSVASIKFVLFKSSPGRLRECRRLISMSMLSKHANLFSTCGSSVGFDKVSRRCNNCSFLCRSTVVSASRPAGLLPLNASLNEDLTKETSKISTYLQ